MRRLGANRERRPRWLRRLTETGGLGAHVAVLGGGVVVPAEEMEKAMRQEHRHLGEDARPLLVGLFPRGGDADNDVAEHWPCKVGEVPFLHREREDVGGSIDMAIEFVQLVHARIVG